MKLRTRNRIENLLRPEVWLAVVGLLAGVALAHFQTRQLAPLPPAPSMATPELPLNDAAQFALPETGPTRADVGAAPAIRIKSAEPPAPIPPLKIFVGSRSPDRRPTASGVFAAQHSNAFTPPDDRDTVWGAVSQLGSSDVNGKTGILNLGSKNAAGEKMRSLDVGDKPDIGLRYPLVKNQDTTFLGRLDGGFSRDYASLAGGQQVPEFLLGAEAEHQFDKRNKVLGSVEYARDVTDPSRTRARSEATWETLLDPDRNVSLRTGVQESSNKTPTGERAKNVDYKLDLIWKF